MMSSIPQSVEEDFYGSSDDATFPISISSARTPSVYSYDDPESVHRAWALRLRPVRTTECIPFLYHPLPTYEEPATETCVLVCDDAKEGCEGRVEIGSWSLSDQAIQILVSQLNKAHQREQQQQRELANASLPPAIVSGLSFTKCQVDPVPTEQSMLSHIRLWENGTFTFQPRQIQASPCVFLGLDERRLGTDPEDVDLVQKGFDLKKPFTICETRQEYRIEQDGKQIVFPRTGMIRGRERFERQEIPLSLSFSDISFDVSFCSNESYPL